MATTLRNNPIHMPATPFHMGIGLVAKPAASRHFSLIAFGTAQILMDIEPLVGILRNSRTLHGVTHTLIGAIIIGMVAAFVSPYIHRPVIGRFNREMRHYRVHWMCEPEKATFRAVCSGAYFGTLSHVMLDSLIYYDIHPFIPFSDTNPFLDMISQDCVYCLCFIGFIAGAVIWVITKWKQHRLSF